MIFTGAESFNYDVLKSMDKGQNIRNGEDTFIEDMRRQRQAWNDQGITVMFTCILGNKHDRPGIGRKTAEIAQEIGVNIVVPYILCVLPGSQDSKTFRDHPEIADIDPDFSHHSSTQPVVQWKHKDAMTKKQVMQEYRELLDTFYQPKNIPLAGISLSAVRQFVWFMISTKLGYHGMDNGMFRKLLVEHRDSRNHRYDISRCLDRKKWEEKREAV